jgi:3-dehydroquinate synthetase
MITTERPLFTMGYQRAGGYPVLRVAGALHHAELDGVLARRRALLVVSPTVERLHGGELDALAGRSDGTVHRTRCASGERAKVVPAVEALCKAAFAAGLDRDGLLVAVGGGVCCDLVTLAASIYRRGVAHVRVPTTLVGQIDAGLGAKGAANFAGRKNAVGCFHPPALVLIDEQLMRTLPVGEVRAGLAEIVKMALVSDRRLFDLVEDALARLLETRFQEPAGIANTIVAVAARRMLEALEGNLFEDRTYRRIVDAGHTFSPRLEAASGFRIRHGEAVAIDLALSAAIAARLGLLPEQERDRIVGLIVAAGLPTTSSHLTAELCCAALADAIVHRGGQLNLPLFESIGRPCFVDEPETIERVLEPALGDVRACPSHEFGAIAS